MTPSFRITPIYDVLLRGSEQTPVGLYHLHLATAEQLCRLHYSPGSIKAIKARLKVLTDNGFIQADTIPTKYYRAPYYYTLGQKGIRYLEEAGYDTHEAWRASKEVDKHALFIEHTLELNDLLIAAALLRKSDPRFSLDSFIHERVLKRKPYQAVWSGGRQTFTIIPDAFLDFRLKMPDGSQRRMPVLLEHDRGTEEQQYFKRRIRGYIMLIKTEAYKELFGSRAITVAFTTFMGPQRLEQMRTWMRQELANESRAIGLTFCFATLSPPLSPEQVWFAPCWYSPYDAQPQALLAA